MTTSGTYSFSMTNADVVVQAYSRAQIRRAALLAEHMADARTELNLLLAEFSNRGVNLWTVDLITQTLVPSVSTYDVDASTIMILDAYISTGSAPAIDRIIQQISRTEYA